MSMTGTYKFVEGKVVKVSNAIPGIGHATSDMCGRVQKPFVCRHLGDAPVHITGRKQLAKELKNRGLIVKTRKHGGGVDDKCHW